MLEDLYIYMIVAFWSTSSSKALGWGSARSLGCPSMVSLGMDSAVLPSAMSLQMACGSIWQPFNQRPVLRNVPPGAPCSYDMEGTGENCFAALGKFLPEKEGHISVSQFSLHVLGWRSGEGFILELGCEVKREGD